MSEKHEIYKYFKIFEKKDGSIIVSAKGLTAHHQANAFRKLSDLGCEIKKTPFRLYKDGKLISKGRALVKLDLIEVFKEYLRTVDLSYFKEKIVYEDIIEAIMQGEFLKMNGFYSYLITE